jgi:hypothetical protein
LEIVMQTTSPVLVRAARAFDFDPFLGCPFDRSEMRIVRSADGFAVGDRVEFEHGKNALPGTIVALGENAMYGDGSSFTAVLIRRGEAFVVKTHKEVRAASLH